MQADLAAGEDLTVLACVKDDWRILRLLASLEEQDCGPGRLRAVVVTSGTEDYRPLIARLSYPVDVVESPQHRLSVARNRGLAVVRTPYLLTTDADCVADPGLIGALLSAFANAPPAVVGVGGRIVKLTTATPTQRHGITINDGQDGLQYLPASPLPYITGACAAFRTAALREVGGYDERYSCGEDVDVCYRLGRAGDTLVVEPRAIVRHEDRVTIAAHFRRFCWYATDQALLYREHHDGCRIFINPYPWRRMASAAEDVARAPAALLRGDSGPLQSAAVTAAEAAGVWAGDLVGSLRHRVVYL